MSREELNVNIDMAAPGTEEILITEFSTCKKYRYRLVRHFDLGAKTDRYLGFVMLNPSTADEVLNDPTITRCINFAKNHGYSGIIVMNLYAFRSTDPKKMLSVEDPVGDQNDSYLRDLAASISDVVCAWGNNAEMSRAKVVVDLLTVYGANLLCLGTNKSGHPKHPLYISGSQQLLPFSGFSDD